MLLNSWLKCQTRQLVEAQRKILIDTVVAFNQLRKNESSFLLHKDICVPKNENLAVLDRKQLPSK